MLRKLPIAALAALPLLHGCGSSSSNSSSGVRLVNATADYASLDLYWGTTAVSTGVASSTAGSYGNVDSGTQTLALRSPATATTAAATVASGSYSISGDTRHTVVAYIDPSSQSSLKGALLTDSESAPSSGTAKFRVFNGTSYTPSGSTTTSGLLDVYVTGSTCSALAGSNVSTPTQLASVKALGAYVEVTAPSAGTSYHVCVTGASNRSDLRLDLPAMTLKDQQIATLVLTASPGGVLVNGVLIDQQGDAKGYANPSARVRIVADAANRGTVSATVGGVELANNLASPVIGAGYVLVPAGALAPSVRINGTALSATAAPSFTAAPGADLTLLVTGNPAASTAAATFIADNNRPSLVTDAPVKLRVVNGVNGLTGGVTLLDNFAAVASNVAFGTASTPANVAATTGLPIEVTTPTTLTVNGVATNSLYRLSGDDAPTLAAGHVYSVFVLGDATAPVGVLRQDR